MALPSRNSNRHNFLMDIYNELQLIYKQNGFTALQKKCKEFEDKYPDFNFKECYFPAKFNASIHKIDSSSVRNYLHLLPDQDPNVHLRSLIPVNISNDGSVLFRAIVTLLGFSLEEDVLDLRIQCLIDILCNLHNYAYDHPDLLASLFDSEEANQGRWSSLVYERAQMDVPNVITVITLISLAKLIKMPIQSVYLPISTEELTNNVDHIYKKLNRIFYPFEEQEQSKRTTYKPIIILWWRTETDTIQYPNHVIPLLVQNDNNSNIKLSSLSSSQSTVKRTTSIQPQIMHNSLMIRARGTFILIITHMDNNKKDAEIVKQIINNIKTAIIELIKIVAQRAQPHDIIEIYLYDEKGSNILLILSCNANTAETDENFDRINAIKFNIFTSINISDCMSAFLDKIARQSTYYRDVFLVVASSYICSIQGSYESSIARYLQSMRSVNFHLIISSDQSASEKESLGFFRIPQVYSIQMAHNSYDIHHRLIIMYEKNHSSQQTEKLESTFIDTNIDINVEPILVRKTIHYKEIINSIDSVSEEHERVPVKSPELTTNRKSKIQCESNNIAATSSLNSNTSKHVFKPIEFSFSPR
ncbi:unnamed protein product [Adineta ricciae]|uniref:Uncharacterized protein n=1 Tax=Adineta ricciae TaxID=249248 RepID=A0A814EF01_ADIRI|nr:unnamed protein product [Adineta ricciae]CAF1401348.1 unnamed protein product [Adineta ricciae]